MAFFMELLSIKAIFGR